ncbi:FecCD family ABC transporter permease [Vibrio sp. RC27]
MTLPVKHSVIWLTLGLLVGVGFCCSLIGYSSFPLHIGHVVDYFLMAPGSSVELQIIESIRMPRALAGVLIGSGLAIAGVVMQGLSQNALASPSILGINSGAACVMALASIGFAGLDQLPSLMVAAIGGIVSGGLVMLLGGVLDDKPHPIKLVLAGVAINALLVGITRASVIIADDKAFSVINWLAGSLASVTWQEWNAMWPASVLGHVIAFLIARQLNLLSLGNEKAVSLGLNLSRTRFLSCVAIILLTASSVSVAGPIGFVGLLVPHIARRVVGNNYVVLIPACAFSGAALITFSDALSRSISFPTETPVGVLTALIGTPVFVILAVRGVR